MLYSETLKKLDSSISKAVQELYRNAFKNQFHENDLFLVLEHGYYHEDILKFKSLKGASPYTVGLADVGWAESAQYTFYDIYRNTVQGDRNEMLKDVFLDEKTKLREEFSIQLETMVYLKFWESESNLKKLFQLSRLCQGLNYDWHFQVEEFRNSKGEKKGREFIIREVIRNQLEKICPNFYSLIKKIYVPQIRNAIAHSQFYFLNRSMILTNYDEDPKKFRNLPSISFGDWEEKIHSVILLYNHMIGQELFYKYLYERKAQRKHFGLPLKIFFENGNCRTQWYKLREDGKHWIWYNTWAKHYNPIFYIS